jgi:uncharacterized protein YndB with AHSA1/START domain
MTDAVEPQNEAIFRISRVFAAPRQRVWDAFTKEDQLAQWSGPKGVTCRFHTFELRPGGSNHYSMHGEGFPPSYGKSVYREVEEPSRLVWVNSFADEHGNIARAPFKDTWPLEMLTTVTLEDRGEGTLLSLEWVPLKPTEEERATFIAGMSSMTAGWNGSFEELDAFLAGEVTA